eukprot:TRINITY_DN344_c0_g1_i29.p2 TRINITY_DN344_c0_g1~~TRINITY_DN344_c0_g1_i29.p2  ORF type:complete len:137 (+),score=20.57 TRINITY_DN344_c0_g1_i29:1364-1774(+)
MERGILVVDCKALCCSCAFLCCCGFLCRPHHPCHHHNHQQNKENNWMTSSFSLPPSSFLNFSKKKLNPQVGFTGPIRPDHVPLLPNLESGHATGEKAVGYFSGKASGIPLPPSCACLFFCPCCVLFRSVHVNVCTI